ncbi:LuxR C-terminal-related transcriptional regulator [Streptomyces sp. DT24]|uniref:helix-turn-helix transcriptional regulator n=1 Tax=unclassified Streptomyces TaxID=2593676 RepID=UPI003CE9329C
MEQQEQTLATASNRTQTLREQISALSLYGGVAQQETSDVEEFTDPAQVRELVESFAILATRQIIAMPPPMTARQQLAERLAHVRAARDRGVAIRTIHQSSASDSARTTAYLKKLGSIGVQVRTAPLLPFRLVVVDDSFALVSPAESSFSYERLLLARHPAVVQLLLRVFEFCWDRTADLPPARPAAVDRPDTVGRLGAASPAERPLKLTEQQLVILQLWESGRTDATIAQELQVSPRTLRRIVSALLRRLGVTSRFEAGVVAARTHGLLCPAGQAAYRWGTSEFR